MNLSNSSIVSSIINGTNNGNSNSNSTSNNTSNSNLNSKKRPRLSDYQNRKTRRRIWQEDEVHKLIFVWGLRLEDLRQSKKNRHIYEEISGELNRMGLDTIREEVHIKIQNLSQLYRNEKRRFDSTGEVPTWLYYHEVDELLGSNQDNTMDSTTHDESEVVSIGDTGSDPETDDNQQPSTGHEYKNGFDVKMQNISCEVANALPSPSTSLASSIKSAIIKPQITSTNSGQRSVPIDSKEPIPKDMTMDQIQLEILNEIRRGNALAEREHAESKALQLEMKGLEEQRFKMTQMFIERSLALQKQMLDCLRMNGAKSMANGNGNDAVSSATDSPFKLFPRSQSSRPQFVLAKKKK